MPPMKKKWIDDLSVLVAVDLKKDTEVSHNLLKVQPLNCRDRTGHVIPDEKYKMQTLVNDILEYANENRMTINKTKT